MSRTFMLIIIARKELPKTVDEIYSLIADYFYLKMTQGFKNSNY